MQLEKVPLGFRDFVGYLVPGFISLGALLVAAWPDSLLLWSVDRPSILIVLAVFGSYIVGQVVYILRPFLIMAVRRLVGDPIEYLIRPPRRGSRLLKRLFRGSDFATPFKSMLVAKLEYHWGKSLVNEAPADAYELCARYVREHSAGEAYYLERCISLRNMHAATVLSVIFLAVVLFVKLQAVLLGFSCPIGAIVFLRGSYLIMVEEAKLVYETFYILQHEVMPEQR